MSKFNNTMNKIFDVVPTTSEDDTELAEYIPRESASQELSALLDHDIKEDYEKTRDHLDSLIAKGTEAIDDMLAIARQSEKSRDFEVAGGLIKTVVEASKELLEVQQKMRNMTGKKENLTQNIKNAVFVGSGKDFIKSIKDEMGE